MFPELYVLFIEDLLLITRTDVEKKHVVDHVSETRGQAFQKHNFQSVNFVINRAMH